MTTRPFLILQLRPEDETADGEFAAILKHGGLAESETRRLRIEHTGIPDLTLEDYAAVIVGGSPLDITTPEQEKSAIQNKIEADFARLFDRIVVDDLPFLGACSGNGLLGSYLGAPMSRRYAEPVGGATVTITEAGEADPLLRGMPKQIRVLLGHKEACDTLPDSAVLLVEGEACPVQMFRVGDNVYATQFHPEGDPEGFIVRVQTYKDHGYFPQEQADALSQSLRCEETPHANEILRRFVDHYRRCAEEG